MISIEPDTVVRFSSFYTLKRPTTGSGFQWQVTVVSLDLTCILPLDFVTDATTFRTTYNFSRRFSTAVS